MENKKFFTENKGPFIFTAIATFVICAIAVAFNVFTGLELPGRIMAAILGVVITAAITELLLNGQTKNEGTLKRDSKIFEEKLKIYQNFLNSLYKAVEDGKLTDSEKMELQFQTSLVAMHCDPKFIKTISVAVNGVIKSTCPNKGDEHTPQTALIASLFDVVEAFRQDLYPGEFKKFDKEDRDNAIEIFKDAYENANEGEDSPKEHLVVDVNLLSNISTLITQATTQNNPELADDNNQKANNIENESTGNLGSLWEKATERWKKAGWTVNPEPITEYRPLWLKREDGVPGEIYMGFHDGHYYLEARYENDSNFSQCLKWKNGGRRRYGEWWEYPPLCFDTPLGEFLQKFESSSELRKYIIDKVEYLQSVIMKNDRTTHWMKEVGKQKDWNLFTWYWTTLACEYQNDAEGKVYMDTMPIEGKESAMIQLGNRANDRELLEQTLKRIGSADKIKDIQEDNFVILEETGSLDPKVVGDRLQHWIKLISEPVSSSAN